MPQNTPFDYVWLGLLIGCFDLGEGGLEQLLDQLEAMGLAATKDQVLQAEAHQLESDMIGKWVGDELTEKGINSPYPSGIDIHDTTNLINSFRPGVFSNLPREAQQGFVEAEKSLHSGVYNGAAKLLVGCVESMMKHFYVQLLPTANKSCTLSDMENALFDLEDRELYPTLYFVKNYRKDYRNPAVHGAKEYDQYDVVPLWHISVEAVSRMAGVLEKRSSLPDSG